MITRQTLPVFMIILLLPLLFSCEFNTTTPPTDFIITFEDLNLESVVRETINKQEGDIYYSDVAELTDLSAQDQNISNLNGIEKLTQLTSITIDFNTISDISPLFELKELTYLNIGYNYIKDITALSSLSKLVELNLNINEIIDITPLSELTQLTALHLYGNDIINISALSSLSQLQFLHLNGNAIEEILPLINNDGISNGDRLGIQDNPLNDDANKIYLPALQARGVDIDPEGLN